MSKENICQFDEDPIHKHVDSEWYFMDETYECHGPFATREYAEVELQNYAAVLNSRMELTEKRNYGKTVAPRKD